MRALLHSNRDWIIVALTNVTAGVMIVYERHTTRIGETAIRAACWASFVVVNLSVVFAIHRRERRYGRALSRNFVLVSAVVTLICCATTSFSLKLFRPKNHYGLLAFSDMPLSSIEPERDRLIVGLIRERAETSKQYSAAVARIAPMVPPLYSPASFENEAVMNKTASQLQSMYEVDRAYAARLEAEMDSFRTRMAVIDPVYLRSWNERGNGGDDEEDKLMDLENRWVKSVSDLYAFAASNKETIAVRNGEIEIENPKVKVRLEQLIASSKELQTTLESERSNALARQKAAASDSGIDREAD